ncbi:hypothetical protein Tco_0738057 [Tanacetum coccineum]
MLFTNPYLLVRVFAWFEDIDATGSSFLLEFVSLKYEVEVLGFKRGSNHKKKSNVNVTGSSCLDYGFPSLRKVVDTLANQDGGLSGGMLLMLDRLGQAAEGNAVPSGMSATTTSAVNTGTLNEVSTRLTPFVNVVNIVPTSTTMNGSEQVVQEYVVKDIPASYANKLSPLSLNKVNLWKLDENVPNGADYDVWLPLASVHEVIRDGLWMIHRVWVKFHDVLLVAYTSDGLSTIAMKISTPMMLESYTNSMCLESWGRSSYARILIEIDA